ncbi:MAG: M28 family peptidase [Dysgonamonadaceae bacterium]|jgi:Zn-dependent M28 family amino/carboxypeptidase|nr:M28 family peptidase [Dysgonamonadaceae bacterium]
MTKQILLISSILSVLFSCGNRQSSQSTSADKTKEERIIVPEFNADSAYVYTANQVAFGPRVSNTQAHRDCGNYLVSELKRFGAEVYEQEAKLQTYDKQTIDAKNIIASFNTDNRKRVLLCAHWDSRPFADHDHDPANYNKPIDGANDGAGACGVLLEIARQAGINRASIGIDIILFDAEDRGAPTFDTRYERGWCLGSKYWAENPHIPDYTALYGILLDMVSAKNARFYREYFSVLYANHIVKKVWEKAQTLGTDNYFINEYGGAVEDDHLPINRIRKIPCIDIIQHEPENPTGFGDYWHTINDTMDEVSKETMKAVGQTVMEVVYNEK